MIYPLKMESIDEERSIAHNTSTISGNHAGSEMTSLKRSRKSKVKLPPIQLPPQNSPHRAERARRRWRKLQTVFLSIRQFRFFSTAHIESPQKLQLELSNFTSTSPLKPSIQASPEKLRTIPRSFLEEHQLVDRFSRLAVNGSKQSLEEMMRIVRGYPKQHIYCPSDPNHLLNAANRNGQTPLYLASKNGHAKVVEFLLRAGANPMLKSKVVRDEEEDALEVAIRWGHLECVKELVENVSYPREYLQQLRIKSNNAQICQLVGQNQTSCFCC